MYIVLNMRIGPIPPLNLSELLDVLDRYSCKYEVTTVDLTQNQDSDITVMMAQTQNSRAAYIEVESDLPEAAKKRFF